MHVRCLITVVYGENELVIRRQLWVAITRIADGIQDEPWLLFGDVNAVLDNSEIWGSSSDQTQAMNEFNQYLLEAGITTLPMRKVIGFLGTTLEMEHGVYGRGWIEPWLMRHGWRDGLVATICMQLR
ncbi:UNVERIFIED_CONTAM: hypothetical protein Sradi_1583000 [Sesamum radiatum]|uniref:Uncharacterized protein n=1 Tax=Sesamum radiatum TaxID=300843 RepID=A0AAW2UAH4_SESRA